MSLTTSVREHYLIRYPAEAARIVEKRGELLDELRELSSAALSPLFEYLDPGHLQSVFLALDPARQEQILQRANNRTALLILSNLSREERGQALERLPGTIRAELEGLLDFPEGTAGRFMDRLASQYHRDQSVEEALSALRNSDTRRARSLYVVDENGVLTGRVDLQDMALADPDTPLSALLNPVPHVAYLTSTEQDLVELFDKSRVDSIPVIDQDMRLLGIVRYTNLFQAAEEAATAGIQRMVGASADEKALSTPLFAVKRRLAWLHVNLVTAFLAAAVVGLFESTIARFTALAVLLPVVAGQSGNAGSQALAVTMRGLALKEVSTLHWRKVLNKEIQIGLINGVALAITCALGVYLWSRSLGLSLVIAIAMLTAMIMAGISGALVPMILSRLGQDPATASSIILTTVTDIAGFMVFLGTATLLAFML